MDKQEYVDVVVKIRKEDAINTHPHEQLEDMIADLITTKFGFRGTIESSITGNTVVFGEQTTEEKNMDDGGWDDEY